MRRTNAPAEDAQALNERMNTPEDRRQRQIVQEGEAAMRPASGAPVNRALSGAELSGEGRAVDSSETSDAIKRAAENDGRV